MQDICNFLPPSPNKRDIIYHHFVYEAELERLPQPFHRNHICLHLAFKGEAILRTQRGNYQLSPGTLFFTFPYQQYEITDSKNFTYLYITFDGEGALPLLEQFGISKTRAIFFSFGHLTHFWMDAIRRVNPTNILVLTESVLLYTLSYLDKFEQANDIRHSSQFDDILQYINNNYADPELSISKVADIFCFNKKYFSALFTKNMQEKFTIYLSKIRIKHATRMLENEKLPVAELAVKCGFEDPFYFSKVFKQITGVSPSKYNPKG